MGKASNFGHVDEVTVEGSICVKLFGENNQLECVVPKNDAPWDFRNTEIVKKFCYNETLSNNLLPFPEAIQMISEYRHEECVDDETKLKQAELEYSVNMTAVKLETCKLGEEAGLCNKDGQMADGISVEDSHRRDFNKFCEKTCGDCVASDREHFTVTVDPSIATFAMDGGEEVPVQVTFNLVSTDSETLQFDSYSNDKLSFEREFHCGEKIQIKAQTEKMYDHGSVTCSIKMAKETQDARVREDGIVVIGGDIEVTFECFNPPSFAPSFAPSVIMPTTFPTTALSEGDCMLDLLDRESYCAKSSTEDCDGTTCTELARSNTQSLYECSSKCRDLENCQYISFAERESDMGDCLMYDECPALKQKDGTEVFTTADICKRVDARLETFHSLKEDTCTYFNFDKTECPGMVDHLIGDGFTSGACPETHKQSHCDATRELDFSEYMMFAEVLLSSLCNMDLKHLAVSYACVDSSLDIGITSCTSSNYQDGFDCSEAFDGIITGHENGWAYDGVVPAWGEFMLEEASAVNRLTILSGVDRSNHHIQDFAIECKVGNEFVSVTNARLSSGQDAEIYGNRITLAAGHESLEVAFDTVQNCIGVKMTVFSTDAANNNLVLTELTVHGSASN